MKRFEGSSRPSDTGADRDPVKAFYGKRRFDRPFSGPRDVAERKGEREGIEVFQGHRRESYAAYIENLVSPEACEAFERVCRLCEAVKAAGGRALLVGGAVRDEVLGAPSKDFDVEVYGLEPDALEELVRSFGTVKDVGKAFGILKLAEAGGTEIDISMPRTDSKVSEGHTGFDVKVDPRMSVKDAARRRDFTFNALSKDPLTGEIYDPFGGVKDLTTRTLRVTDPERFRDDPLRLLRAAQFTGRFGLAAEPETLTLLRDMVPAMKEISVDRVREEWEKLLLRSVRPSMGLTLLNGIGMVDAYYPELAALRGNAQEFEWHPEGDVWTHTLMVTDAAREIVRRRELGGETARTLMLAALCHDLGKPGTTSFVDGRIRSHEHDVKGVEPTQSFLGRIGTRKKDVEKVGNLVREHIWPSATYLHQREQGTKKGSITAGAFRRLAKRLDPATIEELSYVAEADGLGVGPFLDPMHPDQLLLKSVDAYGLEAGRWLRAKAEALGIYRSKPERSVMGRELIALGYAPSADPGVRFGDVISRADDCRDLLGMTKDDLFRILRSYAGDTRAAVAALDGHLTSANNPFKKHDDERD
ncbi:HD domain-containing protein [Candidatus Uhrbacteria bacterium]|nr:HD domain-containing protein [Candidatus Uhrbacteria bacterium]